MPQKKQKKTTFFQFGAPFAFKGPGVVQANFSVNLKHALGSWFSLRDLLSFGSNIENSTLRNMFPTWLQSSKEAFDHPKKAKPQSKRNLKANQCKTKLSSKQQQKDKHSSKSSNKKLAGAGHKRDSKILFVDLTKIEDNTKLSFDEKEKLKQILKYLQYEEAKKKVEKKTMYRKKKTTMAKKTYNTNKKESFTKKITPLKTKQALKGNRASKVKLHSKLGGVKQSSLEEAKQKKVKDKNKHSKMKLSSYISAHRYQSTAGNDCCCMSKPVEKQIQYRKPRNPATTITTSQHKILKALLNLDPQDRCFGDTLLSEKHDISSTAPKLTENTKDSQIVSPADLNLYKLGNVENMHFHYINYENPCYTVQYNQTGEPPLRSNSSGFGLKRISSKTNSKFSGSLFKNQSKSSFNSRGSKKRFVRDKSSFRSYTADNVSPPPEQCTRERYFSAATLEAHLGKRALDVHENKRVHSKHEQIKMHYEDSNDHVIGLGPVTEEMIRDSIVRESFVRGSNASQRKSKVSAVNFSQPPHREKLYVEVPMLQMDKISKWSRETLPPHVLNPPVQQTPAFLKITKVNKPETPQRPCSSTCINFIKKCLCLSSKKKRKPKVQVESLDTTINGEECFKTKNKQLSSFKASQTEDSKKIHQLNSKKIPKEEIEECFSHSPSPVFTRTTREEFHKDKKHKTKTARFKDM